jgi:regulator of sirC expression with transglutaminase-like and TPR domain
MQRVGAARAFERALLAQDGGVDLIGAWRAVDLVADPELDLQREAQRYEELASAIVAEAGSAVVGDEIKALNQVFFGSYGFRGDAETYYDPRNCYAHHVLERRHGMPIALSMLYIDLGRRIGISLAGVGFPAHFIVRAGSDPTTYRYIDPFNGGQEYTREELRAFIARYGLKPEQLETYLAAITPRQILTRLLSNLKRIYVEQREHALARGIVDILIVLTPWALDEIRNRGILSDYLGDDEQAVQDLTAYLESSPNAPDIAALRERVRFLQARR